ncbi:MAG: TIGR00282 family metallophosphoesterase [Lentisphaeria bacterium]
MKVLFIGDIVGKGGRKAVNFFVPVFREREACDFVIANGENMAGGGGMTPKCLRSMQAARVDVFSGGDHMWDQKEFVEQIDDFPAVLRPANVSPEQPGVGYKTFRAANGATVGVVCLLGQTFMKVQADSPFQAADEAVEELQKETPIIFVDMHAEATSEKIAMGRYLEGRVTGVIGSHTHVVTADETILPGGTAYQTDVGMVGARESVLGRAIKPVLHRFVTGMPARFDVVNSGIRIHATLIELDENTGRATAVERIHHDVN